MMSCFCMMTLGNGRIFPILGADGAARIFDQYEEAMAAAEEVNTNGYAIYENLNAMDPTDDPLEVEPDNPAGPDGLAFSGAH